jgi:hypothetical protein
MTALEEAEMTPGEHSETRTKPLPLADSHGRCAAAATERANVSVWEWPHRFTTVLLPVLNARWDF